MKRYIVLCTIIAVTVVFGVLARGYTTDDSSVIATERWESTADGGNGKGVWTISKKSDGMVTVAGEWTYLGFKCPFTAGSATILGSSVSFTATGTANYSSTPPRISGCSVRLGRHG